MIWNANCDSSRPKTKTELLRDLDTWERTQGGQASLTSQSANLGTQIKDKEFDGAGWSARHRDSFRDLIANARMSVKKAEHKPEESSTSTEADNSTEVPVDNTSHEMLPEIMTNGNAQSENQPLTGSGTLIDLTVPSSQPREINPPAKPLAGTTTTSLAEDTVVDSDFAGTIAPS